MVFNFETTYDQRALTAMARGLRKTVRRKRSRRAHIFGGLVAGLILLLLLADGFKLNARTVIDCVVLLLLVAVFIWEDALNGYFAGKKMLPGSAKVTSVFSDGGYATAGQAAETQWRYEGIEAIAESPDYFAFALSRNHAQVYDKRTLTGGTLEEFRAFLEERTGKQIQKIK